MTNARQLSEVQLNVTAHLEHYWLEISGSVAETFRMEPGELSRLQKHPTARLIGCLPWIAGTRKPERESTSNLAVYIMSIRETKSWYAHVPDDDRTVYERLNHIMNFSGGSELLIQKGVALLALQMLHDYRRDQEADLLKGKYNPLNAGTWDYQPLRSGLLQKIKEAEGVPGTELLDACMSVSDTPIVFWEI
jgi:hypothetical protein